MAASLGRHAVLKRICSGVKRNPKRGEVPVGRRSFSVSSSVDPVDLRSDTVTMPSEEMLKNIFSAPVGDDVMGEDPTVLELERFMADKFGKDRGLFLPTGTMANLVALLSHCDKTRAAEIIIGTGSHINLWEGGNAASIGGKIFFVSLASGAWIVFIIPRRFLTIKWLICRHTYKASRRRRGIG